MGVNNKRVLPDDGHSTDPQSELFSQLADPVRRHILLELVGAEADEEYKTREFLSQTPCEEQHRIKLHHMHLPKLAAAGYIDWTPQSDTITPGPHLERIAPTIELLREFSDEFPDGER